jgi:CheY-like chemotaxis protein
LAREVRSRFTCPQLYRRKAAVHETRTCQNLSDILTDLGYQVHTAHDGPTALELVRKHVYDVALLDLKMPGMNGLALYREIKKLQPATVAIVVTAYASSGMAEEIRAAGAWQILNKPVDFNRLLPLMDQALEQPLVLVVDDDPDLCANLWDLFRDRGYRVCVAHDEMEAAARLKERSFKAVLVDMKLPSGDGTRVVRLVRATDPRVCIIVITGYRSEMDQLVRQALAEGADALCEKPFDIPQLLAILESLTAKPQGES